MYFYVGVGHVVGLEFGQLKINVVVKNVSLRYSFTVEKLNAHGIDTTNHHQ